MTKNSQRSCFHAVPSSESRQTRQQTVIARSGQSGDGGSTSRLVGAGMREARQETMGLDHSGVWGQKEGVGGEDVQGTRYTGCKGWLAERLRRHPRKDSRVLMGFRGYA